MFYQVGNQTFINRYLAVKHALDTNQEMRFNMHESAFDRVDWSREPDQTWDQLLDIRAQQIAAKNKPIVLNFTGGTDSYTIFKVFERNNIHIDILFTRLRRTDIDDQINSGVVDFLNKGIYDKTTKIIRRKDDESVFEAAYSDRDWMWTKHGVNQQFSVGFAGDSVTDNWLAQELGTDDFISVNGYDKPSLRFEWHGVYSFQSDNNMNRAIGNPKLDCFYLSPELPELHVKQSYMLLNYIRSKHPTALPRDLMAYNDIKNPNKFDWLEYSIAGCGRYGDLAQSPVYHKAWSDLKMTLGPEGQLIHYGPGSNWYQSVAGKKVLKNYQQGLLDMYNDPVGKYLGMTADDLYKLNGIPSKLYKLTFPLPSRHRQ